MSQVPHISSKNISKIKTIIFDCDGVIWLNETLYKNARKLIKFLKDSNIRVIFLTNASTKSSKTFVEKFKRLGFINGPDSCEISRSQVICPTKIAAHYMVKNGLKKCFVIGCEDLEHDLENSNFNLQSQRHREQLANLKSNDEFVFNFKLDPAVDSVIIGKDLNISCDKLSLCCTYIMNQKAKFIGSNPDPSFNAQQATRNQEKKSDKILIGGGAFTAAIEAAVERKADFIAGKHNLYISQNMIPDFDPQSTMMMGDSLVTDIKFGMESNCLYSCLVLCGTTSENEMNAGYQKLAEKIDENVQVIYSQGVDEILSEFQRQIR